MKNVKLLFILILTVACSSNKTTNSRINALEVSEKLVKGKSTQASILQDFGTPDIVEKTPEGDMWAYNRRANESESIGAGASHYFTTYSFWNFTGVNADMDKNSSSTKTASLVLYFGKDKTLKTYTFRTERF